MPRNRPHRCGGAEKHGARYRVALITREGARSHEYFDTEKEARDFVIAFRSEAKGRTLGTAVTEYLDHLARYGGAKRRPCKPSTLRMVRSKLEGILQLVDSGVRKGNRGRRRPSDLPTTDRQLTDLTPALAQRLYSARVRAVKSNGEPISADTHRSELIYAHAFGQWCVEQGYLRESPFLDVRPEGELSKGKPQLRIDEARAFARAAYADQHPLGGLAAVAVLTLGVRANELLDRRVADLDDGGKVLWIPFGKTASSKRRLAVPPVLRSALLKLAEGQGKEAHLFGSMTDGTLLKHVARLCGVAGVPVVCTHGLRGTQISLTVEVDALVTAASKGAGHADTGVTRQHYMAAGVEQSARAKLMEEILLTEQSNADEAAEIAAAEKEAREAAEKLARLRAKVQTNLGTTAATAYPGTPNPLLSN